MRHVLATALGIALLFALASPAHAEDDDAAVVPLSVTDVIVAAADRWGVDSMSMIRVATCESVLYPAAVGDHGSSLGLFQLHHPGMRDVFYAWGFEDVFSAEQQAEFVARWIALTGNWQPWTCARKLGVR